MPGPRDRRKAEGWNSVKANTPHRRYNPLTGEWVLVSPRRTQRPWGGQVEKSPSEERPAHEANCYLCPGNERTGSTRNAEYESTFVLNNVSSAVLPDRHPARREHPLLRYASQQGACRVVCFPLRHDVTLPEMTLAGIPIPSVFGC